jgi:hypothetical protein
VPSPIIVGALKDRLAPKCTPRESDDGDDVYIPEGCDHQQTQLRLVILFIIAWLLTSPIAFGTAYSWSRLYPRCVAAVAPSCLFLISSVRYHVRPQSIDKD